MSSEETLIQVRKDKHQQLNDGTYPLSREYDENENVLRWRITNYLSTMDQMGSQLLTTINPDDIHLRDEYRWLVRGRITALRKSGAITFIKVTDITGSIQILVSKGSYANYDNIKLLDLGDIIEVLGLPCLSKTGEKSILAQDIKVLTKAHRPPPEKFFGIADQEIKYRKRYLDLMSSEESRARFAIRSLTMRAIRNYMDGRRFMEVETSTLNSVASGANAKPFVTHHNALDIPMRLRIAPELYLKRLLVGGLERVYEIGRNYRNEGIDTRHNPEFTMMESYQAYGRFPDLISFTKELLQRIESYVLDQLEHNDDYQWAYPYYDQWMDERSFTLNEFREVSMYEAVLAGCRKADLTLHLSDDGINADIYTVEIRKLSNERLQKIDINSLDLSGLSSVGKKWAALFEAVAEPFLTEDYRTADGTKSVPVFITEYPKEISPLARSNDQNPSITDRFELFVDGRELCNAFQELNDPDEQAARFQEQLETNHKDPMDFDADYVEALEHGMPPAIGFGMGIDRLVMLLTNTTSIKDVILFPTLRPNK